MNGVNRITGNLNVPSIQNICRNVGRNLTVNSQGAFDVAEIGGKVIIYSRKVDGKGSLMMDVVKNDSRASTLLKRGSIAEQKQYLQAGSEEIVGKIKHLVNLITKAETDESKALTGF